MGAPIDVDRSTTTKNLSMGNQPKETMATTWGDQTSVGKVVLIDKKNAHGKRPGHRLGRREPSGANPVVVSDWHARPSKFDSNSATLELRNAPVGVAEEADRCNLEYAVAHRAELFDEGTDEMDVQSYYRPLVHEGMLRVKLQRSQTNVFRLVGTTATRASMKELLRGSPVCLEVTDHGLWIGDDGSWGARWIVRNVYITGEPVDGDLEDDEFEDAV